MPPDCEALKSCWICSRRLQHLGQFAAVVDLPVLLRRQADAGAVGPAALVGAAEAGRRRPGGRDQLGDGQPRAEDPGLEGSDVLRPDQRRDRPRGPGPATAAARGPTGRGSARRVPCRGATACTRPCRMRRPAGPGSRGSAWRSARRSDPASAPGRSSASSGRAAWTDRGHRARCPGRRDPLGVHCLAPAGLVVSSHSYLKRLSRKPLSHLVGSLVQAPSSPLVMASAPLPVPKVFFQPRPCCSMGRPRARDRRTRRRLRRGSCRPCGRRR